MLYNQSRELKRAALMSFVGTLVCLTALSGCKSLPEVALDPPITETLKQRITKSRNAIIETRRTLARASGSAYVQELKIRLGELLSDEARAHYERLGFRTKNIHSLGEHASIIATRAGTVKTSTLALALRSMGFLVEQHDGFLMVQTGDETPDLRSVLADIRSGELVDLFAGAGNFMSEKFHPKWCLGHND